MVHVHQMMNQNIFYNMSEGKPYPEMEIFTEILETKAGYLHGLGLSVRLVGSSSLIFSIDLSRRLEEVRLEMEEIKVRQKEYDKLLVR
ncbi:hypothetical protein CJ030_MR3G027893 [Morella rubra]|uniref:Uncharacterized protein n=1 Tax=Morella rubra TaxID=262757 RepID=A0A6A1W6F6_9ROSI|nr:hypothetical protein CJ030_MR3G027890 [Morella rubra]KAB1220794.1 hypothetical protein CJ030_MR3G027893 [Morella rubra]